ncbi:MAG: 8-oxo-dGTP diphosphatase MutT [Arcobacter sp.]|nr:MAG: 8-oxo-dGTP diphosphatase MutT [Arcobacter sp.]
MKDHLITAVGAAIINQDKKVLIAKRPEDKPMPNKWEFPGGKLEENESLEKCCIREIKEELDLDIKVEVYLGYENITYKGQEFCLHLYTASLKENEQDFKLNEHDEAQWVGLEDFNKYDFPASKLSFIKRLKKVLDK